MDPPPQAQFTKALSRPLPQLGTLSLRALASNLRFGFCHQTSLEGGVVRLRVETTPERVFRGVSRSAHRELSGSVSVYGSRGLGR